MKAVADFYKAFLQRWCFGIKPQSNLLIGESIKVVTFFNNNAVGNCSEGGEWAHLQREQILVSQQNFSAQEMMLLCCRLLV